MFFIYQHTKKLKSLNEIYETILNTIITLILTSSPELKRTMASLDNQTVSNDCTICCETYNKGSRKRITCPKPDCSFDCCSTCFKTYILENTSNPTCMNCKTFISNQFIVDNINRSFYTGQFKKKLTNELLESEKSKMPETMPFVKIRTKFNKEKEVLSDAKTELRLLEISVSRMKHKIYRCENRLRTFAMDIDADEEENNRRRARDGNGPAEEEEEQHQFIMPCRNDSCRGFLNKKYHCELCDCYTCPHCLEFMGNKNSLEYQNHKCKEENVESAKMIKKDTKPCPKCGIRIHKIDGCDQMWCTECKVAFSWKKGTIEKGTVHNPHYYQWLKNENGAMDRNPLDVICGGLQDFRNISVTFRRFYQNFNNIFSTNKKINDEFKRNIHSILNNALSSGMFQSMIYSRYSNNDEYNFERISYIHQKFHHISQDTIPIIVRDIQNLQDNRKQRVSYMMNDIDEDKFKSTIMKNHIDLNVKQELLLLYQLIQNFGIDLFNEYVTLFNNVDTYYNNYALFEKMSSSTHSRDIKAVAKESCTTIIKLIQFWDNKMNELKHLCQYFNEQTRKISITYGRTVPVYLSYFGNERHIKFTQKITDSQRKILEFN